MPPRLADARADGDGDGAPSGGHASTPPAAAGADAYAHAVHAAAPPPAAAAGTSPAAAGGGTAAPGMAGPGGGGPTAGHGAAGDGAAGGTAAPTPSPRAAAPVAPLGGWLGDEWAGKLGRDWLKAQAGTSPGPDLKLVLRLLRFSPSIVSAKLPGAPLDEPTQANGQVDEANRQQNVLRLACDIFVIRDIDTMDKKDLGKTFTSLARSLHPDKTSSFCKKHRLIDLEEQVHPLLNKAFAALKSALDFLQAWKNRNEPPVHAQWDDKPEKSEDSEEYDAEGQGGEDSERPESPKASKSRDEPEAPLAPSDSQESQDSQLGNAVGTVTADSAEDELPPNEHGSNICDSPFFSLYGADPTSGLLDCIGRDTLSFFGSLLRAGGLLVPSTWQKLERDHLEMTTGFLRNCLDALPKGTRVASGAISLKDNFWMDLLDSVDSAPHPGLVRFMLDTTRRALPFNRVIKTGLDGKVAGIPNLPSFSNLQHLVMVGPELVEEMRGVGPSSNETARILKEAAIEGKLGVNTALLLVDSVDNVLIHVHPGDHPEWNETIYTSVLDRAVPGISNVMKENVLNCMNAILAPRDSTFGMTLRPAFKKAPVQPKTAAFEMFIHLAHILTGESIPPNLWQLCLDLQRSWWVLQLLREAERSGAITAEWLEKQLNEQVKVRKDKMDEELIKLMDPDVAAERRGGAPAAANSIGANEEELLTFIRRRRGKGLAQLTNSEGYLHGTLFLEGRTIEASLEMFATPKNGSCFSIAFLKTLAALYENEDAKNMAQSMLSKEVYENFCIWAVRGSNLQGTSLDCMYLRELLCGLIFNHMHAVKGNFSASPSVHEVGDMKAARARAKALGFDNEDGQPDCAHARMSAIALLDPHHYFAESVIQFLLEYVFCNQLAIVMVTKQKQGGKQHKYKQHCYQPLMNLGKAQLALVMVYEMPLPACGKKLDTDANILAEAALQEKQLKEQCGGVRMTRQSSRNLTESSPEELRKAALQVKADTWAKLGDQNHFTRAHVLDKDGQCCWIPVRGLEALDTEGEPSGSGGGSLICGSPCGGSASANISQRAEARNSDGESGSGRGSQVCSPVSGGSPSAADLKEAEDLVDEASRESQEERFRSSQPPVKVATEAKAPEIPASEAPAKQISPISPSSQRLKPPKNQKDMPAKQKRISSFFHPTCKGDSKPLNLGNDGDDDSGAQHEGGADTSAASSALGSSKSASVGSGSGDTKAGTGGTQLGQQLRVASDLLKKVPITQGLEFSVQLSSPTIPTRRNLFASVLNASKHAASDATNSRLLGRIVERVACYVLASAVLETESTLGPKVRQVVRDNLHRLQEVGVNGDTIYAALAAAEQSPRDAPSASQNGDANADSAAEVEKIPIQSGVQGMLQSALETCCMCLSAPGNACLKGHILRFCQACIKAFGDSRQECQCQAVAASLMKITCRRGGKALKPLTREILMNGREDFVRAARLLVLAAAFEVESVISALLDTVLEVIKAQLGEKLSPCATAEQVALLNGRHRHFTPFLVRRVAQAFANPLREHISFNRVIPPHQPESMTSPHQPETKPQVGFLAGHLNDIDLDYVFEPGNWLIINAGGVRTAWANDLVKNCTETNRLLVLTGTAEEQAAQVLRLALDILVLIAFPNDDMEFIMASHPARKTVNWRGMSSSYTDACDFTLIGSSSAPHMFDSRADQRVIQVGFDQLVQTTFDKTLPNRKELGLPDAGFVVMFPGFSFQLDKNSLWTWMHIVAGVDRSALVLTLESPDMKPLLQKWVADFVELFSTVTADRVLLLEYEGRHVHQGRIAASDLCVSTVTTMLTSCHAARALAEGVGCLVLKGSPGSTDVGASGLGQLLIAEDARDFVCKGHAWASHGMVARIFLAEQKEKRKGYYSLDKARNALNQIYCAVHRGDTQVPFDEGAVFEDDQKVRWARILEIVRTSGSQAPFYYRPMLERIFGFLESNGVKLVGVVAGGSAFVLEGVLTRDVSPRDKRGKRVVAKVAQNPRRISTVHNSLAFRHAWNASKMSFRLRKSRFFSLIVPRPIPLLLSGRSSIAYTEPNTSKHVIVVSIEELVERRFEDALTERAREWQEGVISHSLVLDFQDWLLSLWHLHRNGGIAGNMKPQNIGQNGSGKVVFCDLGNGWCGPPKGGDAFGRQSGPTPLSRRNSTFHFAAAKTGEGSNPQGDANLFLASGKDRTGFRCMTTKDLSVGEERARQRERGLGRLGNGPFTFYDVQAVQWRDEQAKEDPDVPLDLEAERDGDVYQLGRAMLQVFHPVSNAPGGPADWERQATAAAAGPDEMKRFMLEGSPAAKNKLLQPLAFQRFADWLAATLGETRLSLISTMTHLAMTVPVLEPEVELGVLSGAGFEFAGGIAGEVYPGIKPEWGSLVIPPTCLLLEPDGKKRVSGQSLSPEKGGHLGVGNQLRTAVKEGDLVGFYCGTKRALDEGAMDTFPSRFGVSIRSARQKEKISIDGFLGRKLTMQWLIEHQATGAFMNAGDWDGGLASNVSLNRHTAWTDPKTGIVWMAMYAIFDIAAGEFLRWKYSPVDGEGGIYTFKSAVQSPAEHPAGLSGMTTMG